MESLSTTATAIINHQYNRYARSLQQSARSTTFPLSSNNSHSLSLLSSQSISSAVDRRRTTARESRRRSKWQQQD
eukprot:scaffold3995_cov183-Alexandrium_tamarense.AAC.6